MAEYTAPSEPGGPSPNGSLDEIGWDIEALRTESQAAVEAGDWATAALKFEEILALDPHAQFARVGLQHARQKLEQPEPTTSEPEQPGHNVISVRQLRMYIHVRRAVTRLLRRARPPLDT